MKIILTILLVLAVMTPALAADDLIGPRGWRQQDVYEFFDDAKNSLNRNRATFVASVTDDSASAATGVVIGTVSVLISNVPYFENGATVSLGTGTPGNVVGSTTLYTACPYVVFMNAAGTYTVTKGTNGTGSTAAIAKAASVLPAIATGTAPIAVVMVTVDPRGAGAMTWTAGTSLTTTSEVMALVGGYDIGDHIVNFNPVKDSGK